MMARRMGADLIEIAVGMSPETQIQRRCELRRISGRNIILSGVIYP